MAAKLAWHLISPKTVLIELAQVLVALAFLALGWVTFPLVFALTGVEILLVVLISGALYRLRSAATIVIDTLKSVALWMFCGVFIMGAYYAARGSAHDLGIEPRGFAILAALLAVRLGVAFIAAHASPDPRLHWTREVATRGAVLALSLFFGAFACFVPGVFIVKPLALVLPGVAADVALGFCLLTVQALLSCVVSTMTPEELAEISRQPYHTP